MRMPEMLKKRWQKATCSDRGMDSASCASADKIPVIVVPILEPRVRGYIRSSSITPMPTSGVKVEVKIELLCTRMVKPAPKRSAK